MPRVSRAVAAATLCLFLAVPLGGCAVTGMGAGAPSTFDLRAPLNVAAHHTASYHLVVDEPVAVRALATERILVKPNPQQITYFKGAVWSDRLTRLVQARIIETFQNGHAVKAVGARGDGINADLTLSLEVRAFQIEIDQAQARAHVDIYAKLIDDRSDRIVASHDFSASANAPSDDKITAVAALNNAFGTVASDMMNWAASKGRGNS